MVTIIDDDGNIIVVKKTKKHSPPKKRINLTASEEVLGIGRGGGTASEYLFGGRSKKR